MFEYIRNNNSNSVPTTKMIPSTAGTTYKVGEALTISSGAAVVAAGTTSPEYVAACDYVAPASGNEQIAVYQVTKGMEFTVPFSADGTAIAVGNKVTIGADGLTITATTASGVAEVISKLGTGASGTKAIVRF